jgi:polyisoprenoid-binding protein YceI
MLFRSLLPGVLAALGILSTAAMSQAESFTIDAGHSTVLYRALHMGLSHSWGRFNDVSGSIDLDEKSPLVDLSIKAESIDTFVPKRDEHLRGPDFFNVRQFPTITFKSDKIRSIDAKTYEVSGTLTLHGISQPTTVKLTKIGGGPSPFGDQRIGVETIFQIKRTDFGMKNMLEGVGDEVLLIVSLEAAHK